MCYTRKDRDLEREAREITESRLIEEEARLIGMKSTTGGGPGNRSR